MSAVAPFIQQFLRDINTLVAAFAALNIDQDRINNDPTIAAGAPAALTAMGRTDITVTDLANAAAAVNTLLATCNSTTNPVVKPYLYKVL